MRTFLVLLIAAGLGALFYHQKHETPDAPDKAPSAAIARPGASAATQSVPPPVSEHNWMKRSLDRATEVRNTSRAQTQQSQDP